MLRRDRAANHFRKVSMWAWREANGTLTACVSSSKAQSLAFGAAELCRDCRSADRGNGQQCCMEYLHRVLPRRWTLGSL